MQFWAHWIGHGDFNKTKLASLHKEECCHNWNRANMGPVSLVYTQNWATVIPEIRAQNKNPPMK